MEATLKLRSAREAAAVARGRARVAAHCAAVGVPCDVLWEAFLSSSLVQQSVE